MATDSLFPILAIAGSLLLAASSGAIFKPGIWYDELNKPSWNPPDFLFPIAWTVLYIMIGYATYLVWRDAGPGEATLPLTFFAIQVILNGAWSYIFFGIKQMGWAMVEMTALWLSIVAMILTYMPINETAAYLLLPYLAWVSFAFFLNYTVRALNPDSGRDTVDEGDQA